ncbi:hypothetical protein Agub_g3196, partial [Astrephomene gubernaculifera]
GQQQQGQRERERRRRVVYSVGGFAAVHEVAVSENYYVLLQPPVHPEVLPYLLGEESALGCLRWREGEEAVLHVVPRPGSGAERRGEQPLRLPLRPALFAYHLVNAFEGAPDPSTGSSSSPSLPHPSSPPPEDGWTTTYSASSAAAPPAAAAAEGGGGGGVSSSHVVITLDAVVYDRLPAAVGGWQPHQRHARAEEAGGDAGWRPRLQRLHLHLASRTVTPLPTPAPPRHPHLELPAFNTAYTARPYRYVYGCSPDFSDASCGLSKADLTTRQSQRWCPGPGYLCSQPTFVPRRPAAAANHTG